MNRDVLGLQDQGQRENSIPIGFENKMLPDPK